MYVKGRTALVTGAGRGIGQAIALRFAQEGANVGVIEIDPETAHDTAEKARAYGVRAEEFVCDVTQSPQVRETVRGAIDRFGRIDILVNDAGWDKAEPFIESSEETWNRVIEINLKGTARFCHAILPHFIENKGGHIVNIGSDAGRVGSSGEAVYSGAKGGVIAFSKTVAREVAEHGITVNTVCPGPTRTPLVAELEEYNPRLLTALERSIPFKRLGKPEEVAAAVVFLASDDASFITGQTLSVSGGLTMA